MSRFDNLKAIELVLVGVVIMVSADTLTFGTVNSQSIVIIGHIINSLIILWLIVKPRGVYSNNRIEIPLLISSLLILLTVLLNFDLTLGYVIQLLVMMTGCYIAKNIELVSFLKSFNIIVYGLSCISLIFFIISYLYPEVLDRFSSNENHSGTKFTNLFFYSQLYDKDGQLVMRNTSIFREPGVFMIYINLAIIFELFFKENIDKRHISIFFITLVSTFSTAGYIIGAVIFVYFFFSRQNVYRNNKGLVVLLFILLSAVINFGQLGTVFSKLNSSTDEYGSFVARMASIEIPITIFINNPWGEGISNFSIEFDKLGSRMSDVYLSSGSHATNTHFSLLATYGFLFFILTIISLYLFSSNTSDKKYNSLVIFIIIFALFSNEDLRYSSIYSSLMFYGWKYI